MSSASVAFKKRTKPSLRKRETESDAAETAEPTSQTREESPLTLATKLKKRAKPRSTLSFGADEEVRTY